MHDQTANEQTGHKINGRIYSTEQLKEKAKQNLLYDKYVHNKKQFWDMFVLQLINYILSPVFGLPLMMERFGSNIIRNRFRHRYEQFSLLVLPTIGFFVTLSLIFTDVYGIQIYLIITFYTLILA